MEKNETSVFMKIVAGVGIGAMCVAAALVVLSMLGIMADCWWAAYGLMGVSMFCQGVVNWRKERTSAVFNFVVAALAVIGAVLRLPA